VPQALRSTTRRVEAIDDGHTLLTGPHGVRYGAIAIIVAVCAAGALGARDFFYNLFPDGHAVGINVLPYDHGALTPCASDSEPRGRDCGKSVKYPVGV
jgi:hypothetical protein